MYHVIYFAEGGCYTVGTGTLGVDWEPVADFLDAAEAQADAELRNSPHIYALLEKAQRQINQALARLERLEKIVEAAPERGLNR